MQSANHDRWKNLSLPLVKLIFEIRNQIITAYRQPLTQLKAQLSVLELAKVNSEEQKSLTTQITAQEKLIEADISQKDFIANYQKKLQTENWRMSASLEHSFLILKCHCFLLCEKFFPVLHQHGSELIPLAMVLNQIATTENVGKTSQSFLPTIKEMYSAFETAIGQFTTLPIPSNAELLFEQFNQIFTCEQKEETIEGPKVLLDKLNGVLKKFDEIFLAANIFPWLKHQAKETHKKLLQLPQLIDKSKDLTVTTTFPALPAEQSFDIESQYLKKLERWAETTQLIIQRKINFLNKKEILIDKTHKLFSHLLGEYIAETRDNDILTHFIDSKLSDVQLSVLEKSHQVHERVKVGLLLNALYSLLQLQLTLKADKRYLAFDFPKSLNIQMFEHEDDEENYLYRVTNWAIQTRQNLMSVVATPSQLKEKHKESAYALLMQSRSRVSQVFIETRKNIASETKHTLPSPKNGPGPSDKNYNLQFFKCGTLTVPLLSEHYGALPKHFSNG